MTHSPPIPPGNQSPYPIAEVPHADHQPATREPFHPRQGSAKFSSNLLIGAVVAAAGLLAAGAALTRWRGKSAPVKATSERAKATPRRAKVAAGGTRTGAGKATAKAPTTKARSKRATRGTSDDKANRGPQDASRIAMGEDYEVRYWTKKFGVDREGLQLAVDAVGNGSAAVERELGKS